MGFDLLRAEDGGCGEVFVDGRKELDAVVFEAGFLTPKFQIDGAQGRAPVAGDKARGIEASGLVAAGLVKEDAGKRLGAGEENPASGSRVAIVEAVGLGWGFSRHRRSPLSNGRAYRAKSFAPHFCLRQNGAPLAHRSDILLGMMRAYLAGCRFWRRSDGVEVEGDLV